MRLLTTLLALAAVTASTATASATTTTTNTTAAATAATARVPAAAATPGTARATPRQLNFDVFLDGRAIGYQRFDLSQTDDRLRIDTRAEFEVKLLLITAFAYDHRNTETWEGGCLQAIDARTNSNGKASAVSGRASGGAFVVSTNDGERRLDECVATFAYWDRDVLLRSPRLLNSQTGEYAPVRVERLGRDAVRIGAREIPVERYAIRGEGLDITLAYAAGGTEWVALDSRLESGRTLQYRRRAAELDGVYRMAAARAPLRQEVVR
ncbi:MAG: DUF6134 family protein [Pseudomonadota bacterium]